MIFFIAIIGIFVAVSIYFFFRAETLQREVLVAKREVKVTKKENKIWVDSMAVMTSRYEEFAKRRFSALRESSSANQKHLEIMAPLINNYSAIATECLKAKGQLVNAVGKVYQSLDTNAYKNFTGFIATQEPKVQRFWSSNNLKGFIALVEELLIIEEKRATK